MVTTTGSSGMAEPVATPKPKRVNKLAEAIAKATEPDLPVQSEVDQLTYVNVRDFGNTQYFPSPQETARLEKQEKARSDRILFRESLKAFIVALEVKHPAHMGAAVALADEYVKVVNMRYPFDLT